MKAQVTYLFYNTTTQQSYFYDISLVLTCDITNIYTVIRWAHRIVFQISCITTITKIGNVRQHGSGSIVQCVTHLDLRPPEPKSLTLVILHNMSRTT